MDSLELVRPGILASEPVRTLTVSATVTVTTEKVRATPSFHSYEDVPELWMARAEAVISDDLKSPACPTVAMGSIYALQWGTSAEDARTRIRIQLQAAGFKIESENWRDP